MVMANAAYLTWDYCVQLSGMLHCLQFAHAGKASLADLKLAWKQLRFGFVNQVRYSKHLHCPIHTRQNQEWEQGCCNGHSSVVDVTQGSN